MPTHDDTKARIQHLAGALDQLIAEEARKLVDAAEARAEVAGQDAAAAVAAAQQAADERVTAAGKKHDAALTTMRAHADQKVAEAAERVTAAEAAAREAVARHEVYEAEEHAVVAAGQALASYGKTGKMPADAGPEPIAINPALRVRIDAATEADCLAAIATRTDEIAGLKKLAKARAAAERTAARAAKRR